MVAGLCLNALCFVPLSGNASAIFNFSSFLSGLALLVLVWTIADDRYHFRIKSAPIPLHAITFYVVLGIGLLTLLTDLWKSDHWIVIRGNLITTTEWETLLGFAFFITFLTWAWFAFIRPAKYSKANAHRFAKELYEYILQGSPTKLAIIADELQGSIKAIVQHAPERRDLRSYGKKIPKEVAYADDLLLLIADKRFCRAIVSSSPVTALYLYEKMGELEKYDINIKDFSKNLVAEALSNKDSFLFHESESFFSGLLGEIRPLTQAIFGNYHMAETIGVLFDVDWSEQKKWDSKQWETYCGLVLMTFKDFIKTGNNNHSFILYRAFNNIKHALLNLSSIDGMAEISNNPEFEKLSVVVDFIQNAIAILDENGPPEWIVLKVRHESDRTFYDYLADMIVDVVFHAARIRSPQDICWVVQHNCVWSEFFSSHKLNNRAGKIVLHKVRRKIYDEIVFMEKAPNYKGAAILGICLNAMGFNEDRLIFEKESWALQRAILNWTKKNFENLYTQNPKIAQSCFVDGMTYDKRKNRLVKKYTFVDRKTDFLEIEKLSR